MYLYIFFHLKQSPGLEIRDRREISSSFPDISVAFKLHQEGGKLINLYDWLQVGEDNTGPLHQLLPLPNRVLQLLRYRLFSRGFPS